MKITQVMGRRRFIAGAVSFVGLSLLGSGRHANAAEALDPEILKTQLRVKNDAEEAFVDDVVKKVKEGAIPTSILTSAYRYAIKKETSKRMIYFKYCLETLTKRAGIKVQFKTF